jgi:hypothetical protein
MLALERFNPPVSQYTNRPNIGMQTAGYVAATIPQLVVFALGMKYFVEGMTSGSVKAEPERSRTGQRLPDESGACRSQTKRPRTAG